jgi:cytochrome c-type biogenesis protein CcmH
MRGIIRAKLEGGETRQEILGYFAERYGESILLAPPRTGFGLVVWVAPYVALVAALGFVVWRVRSWRSAAAADQATPAPQADPLAPELASYAAEVDRAFARVRDQPLR